jgi:hypothetical protein
VEVAVRHTLGEGVAPDADRRRDFQAWMPGEVDPAMTEPGDRLRNFLITDQGDDLFTRPGL